MRETVMFGLAAWYASASLVTFAAYAADKSAAIRGRFRIRESTLHLMELIGGWPGALLAQRILRHKTKKRSYQLAFWMCVVANISAFACALSLAAPR